MTNIESTIGCFINTLPLLVNHQNDGINVIDKIKEIQNSINELNIYSNVKLSKLQINGRKLFEVLFVYENFPDIKNENIDKLNINYIDTNSDTELDFDVPINIIVYENKSFNTFNIEISYKNELDCYLIKDTIKLFDYILNQIIDNLLSPSAPKH